MYEVWKDVIGYEGLYQVSDNGRVRSLDRIVKHKSGERKIKGRMLKLQEDAYGYLVVHLYKNKKRKPKKVHRLVAEVFLENPNQLPTVHHKDEDKKNNSVSNLEYCTSQDNSRYSFSKRVKGTNVETGEVIYFNSTKEAGRNGFSSGNVSSCCNGKMKQFKGYEWEYVNGEVIPLV